MITKSQIVRFYDAEAEVSRQKYNELMRLPVSDRIRKRKAVDGLRLVEDWHEISPEKELLLRLTVRRNLSDFKEGEYLLLHRADERPGLNCVLYAFTEDDDIIISVSSFHLRDYPVEQLMGHDLVLDTVVVDLRDSVNSRFYEELPDSEEAWSRELVNRIPPPHFLYRSDCERELSSLMEEYGLSFTRRQREAVVGCMAADNYYLIQGPPGTGKSFVLAVIILEEMLYFHRKVAVVGPNHLAINNALKQVLRLSPDLEQRILKIGQLFNARNLKVERDGRSFEVVKAPRVNSRKYNAMYVPMLYGFTSFSLYTSRARDLEFDTLVIDEAGQMTLPNALMAMTKARKIILAGDHKQLPPIISSDKIPGELRASVFERLMRDDNHTMLDVSFRMRGEICRLVSELFYGGGLQAMHPENGTRIRCDHRLLSFDSPVVMVDVDDEGLQCSEKEAARIVSIIEEYVALGLPPSEVAVLSPFRAQAALVRRELKRSPRLTADMCHAIAVDTVDKMQGQEREVIIVSLAAGDWNYICEMGDFLYNPNKLNVAFSRAQSKLIVVGNVAQMRRLSPTDYPHIATLLQWKGLTLIER